MDIEFQIESDHNSNHLRIYIEDEDQCPIIVYPIQNEIGSHMEFASGTHNLNIPLGVLYLNSGNYNFVITIVNNLTKANLLLKSGISQFQVLGATTHWTKIVRPTVPRIFSVSHLATELPKPPIIRP